MIRWDPPFRSPKAKKSYGNAGDYAFVPSATIPLTVGKISDTAEDANVG